MSATVRPSTATAVAARSLAADRPPDELAGYDEVIAAHDRTAFDGHMMMWPTPDGSSRRAAMTNRRTAGADMAEGFVELGMAYMRQLTGVSARDLGS